MGLDATDLSTPKAPEVRLGQRERLVAEKRLAGASADEIASELGIKASSVRSTMHRVYKKYGVDGLSALREVALDLSPAIESAAIPTVAVEQDDESDFLGSLIAKVGFLLCMPAAVLYVLLYPFTSFRTDLNDYLVLISFCAGTVLGFMFTRVFRSHRRLLNPILCIGAAGAVIAFCIVSFVHRLLFATVMMSGHSIIASYLLVAVLGLLSAWLLKIGPVVLFSHPVINLLFCITLIIVETFLASWASIDASLAIVILVGSLVSSFALLLMHSLGVDKSGVLWGEDVRSIDRSVFAEVTGLSFAFVFVIFGVIMACVVLPRVDSLINAVLALPMIAIILCSSVTIVRARALNIMLSAVSIAVSLLLPIIASALLHSSLAGFGLCACLEIKLLAASGIDIGLSRNFKRFAMVRFASFAFVIGLVLGCFIVSILDAGTIKTALPRDGVLLLGALFGIVVLLSSFSIIGVYTIYSSVLDALSCARCADAALSPDALQRVRAYFTFHGFSNFEIEVALRTASGSTVASIARDLHYSAGSVKAARLKTYRLLSVHDACSLNVAFQEVIGL